MLAAYAGKFRLARFFLRGRAGASPARLSDLAESVRMIPTRRWNLHARRVCSPNAVIKPRKVSGIARAGRVFDSMEREPVEYVDMTATVKRIEQEIRELPLEDMLVLHDQLVSSIHEKEDAQKLDPAFREEIQRRVKEIDSGKAEGVDALQALKEM